MKDKLIKISFLGDIMCEMPLLRASKVGKGQYHFEKVFDNMKEKFQESDYVVGNLETISAGKDYRYTNHIYSFNTPSEFIESIKISGIDLVTTATNHSLDRGVSGLIANLNTLDRYDLKNDGTYRDKKRSEELFIEEINGSKIAFLNYTFGANAHINGVELTEDELVHIKLLKPQTSEIKKYKQKTQSKQIKSLIARTIFKFISLKNWVLLKRKLGFKYNTSYQDNDLSEINNQYLNKIKAEILDAKASADLVIVCMHSGGQFHPEPGKFSKYMMQFMKENGVDIVVGNHPHVVQKSEWFSNGMFGAYSLGNFSISPGSVYVIDDDLPEYSIMLHFYIGAKSKKVEKVTFTILKIVEFEDESLTVYPIDHLYEVVDHNEKTEIVLNATKIYNRFLNENKKTINIESEYKL